MRAIMPVILSAVLVTSCFVTRGPRDSQSLVTAAGRTVLLQLDVAAGADRLEGELLDVRDSTLIVRAHEVFAVPFGSVRRLRLEGTTQSMSRSAALLYLDSRPGDYLREFSRYPHGAPPQVMQEILRTHGQEEPRRIGR